MALISGSADGPARIILSTGSFHILSLLYPEYRFRAC